MPGFNVIKDFEAYDARTRHTNADFPERMSEDELTRISHRLPAATADTLADTALRSVGRLDVLSSTPAAASVARLVSATSRPFRDGNR